MAKKNIVFATLIFILFTSSHYCFAEKDKKFLKYAAQVISEDCQNKKIHIKKGYIKKISNDKYITIITPPHNVDTLASYLWYLSLYEPYKLCANGLLMGQDGQAEGNAMLTCGNNKLDISRDEWFWNNKRIELPQKKAIINNLVIFGISIFSPTVISISLVTLIISIIWRKNILAFFVNLQSKGKFRD